MTPTAPHDRDPMDPDWLNGVRMFVVGLGVVLVIVVLGVVGALWEISNPPTSSGAREREQVLLGLPAGDLAAVGLVLVDESSSPGEEASGFMVDSPEPVSVVRRYKYEGDPLAACEAALAQLAVAGWTVGDYPHPCERSESLASDARVTMERTCGSFDVSLELTADDLSSAGDTRSLQVSLRAEYPEDPPRSNGYENPPSGYKGTTTTVAAVPPGRC